MHFSQLSSNIHWFAVACLLENLRRHVARCSTRGGQDVELFLVHDPRQAKIRNKQVCIVFWGAEQEIFGFEVSMDDAVVVQVRDR